MPTRHVEGCSLLTADQTLPQQIQREPHLQVCLPPNCHIQSYILDTLNAVCCHRHIIRHIIIRVCIHSGLQVKVWIVYDMYLHCYTTEFLFFYLLCVYVHRSDCVDILTQCGDRKRFHEGQTPERICSLLSPIDDPERCIPLHRYLSELKCSVNISAMRERERECESEWKGGRERVVSFTLSLSPSVSLFVTTWVQFAGPELIHPSWADWLERKGKRQQWHPHYKFSIKEALWVWECNAHTLS